MVIWTLSIALGFIQSFTYAEIAGLFPDKSGGASIYGALGLGELQQGRRADLGVVQLVRLVAGAGPGSALAAGYILYGLFAPDS